MGKFTYNPPADFLKQLDKLSKVDEIAPMMIDEALPIVADKLKKELAFRVRSGSLQASIKNTKAKKAGKNGGFFAAAMPTGTDENGTRNASKLAYIEYGTSRQAAKPVIRTAVNDSESSVLSKMQSVFTREVTK